MNRKSFTALLLASAAAVIVLDAVPALADAIDGDWCHKNGKHIAIQGPDIVTPVGTRTKGNYDRHAFSYEVPAKDPGAGETINMILVDEDTIYLRSGAAPGFGPGEAEVWNRCKQPTS
jgi:hypothetical protein